MKSKKVLFLTFLLTAVMFSTPLWAATFTVSKTADTKDGTCNADCSLREAVIAAKSAGGSSTITLPAGTYTRSDFITRGEEAAASGGTLSVTRCTISGNGAENDGGGIYYADGGTGTLTIINSTIAGNSAVNG